MTVWDLLPSGTRAAWLFAAMAVAACLAGAGVAALASRHADEHTDDDEDGLTTDWRWP